MIYFDLKQKIMAHINTSIFVNFSDFIIILGNYLSISYILKI